MAGRKLVKIANTEELMGEGTFVKYIEPLSSDMDEYRFKLVELQALAGKLDKEGLGDTEELKSAIRGIQQFQSEFLAKHIVEWNWVVDEAGEIPMAQPHNNPDVFLNELRDSERQFLNGLFLITPEKKAK